jgi:cytidine deaminase
MAKALELSELITRAREVRQNAHAPYSEYQVGAAIETASGTIFTGCNVENASYGLTICAERGAICAMVAAGERQIQTIVICTEDGGSPCGACRQVIAEFGSQIRIVTVDGEGKVRLDTSIRELLPEAFRR